MNQSLALGIMLAGHSVFLTGAAGSGKTHTLNEFISMAKKRKKRIAVTATTGLAAAHLGGNTIHAWSGIGILDELHSRFFDKLSNSRIEQIQKTDILIIDEISMLHDYRLDLVDQICQKVREDSRPFGGIQIVIAGDFFQLPPVNRPGSRVGGFAINSGAWQTLDPTICYLTEQHRQNDGGYLEVLEALRGNNLRRHHAETLLSRVNANLDNENITELHTTNLDVDDLNYSRLNRIVSKEYTYEMLTTGSENYVDNLKRACLAPEILRLKQGALVVALKNHPSKKYANGSIGVVEEFDKLLGLPIVKFNNGHTVTMSADSWELRDGEKKRASLTQIPLRLAWALTVHKAQGMTLDAARVDLSRAFVPGMGYVALSRVKSLDSLSLAGLNRIALQVAPEATRLDEDFREACRIAVRDLAHLEVGEKERSYDPVSIKKIKLPKDPLVAKEKAARSAAWNEKILKLRKTVPKANMAWTIEESHELMELFLESMSVWELSRHFGRKPVAIMLRLNLSLGAELFAKQDIMDFRNAIKRAPEMAEEVFGAVKLEAK